MNLQNTMNAAEIFAKVVGSAERFGSSNPQQLKQLSSLLGKCAPNEVLLGLLRVFTECPEDDMHFQRQELAGRLLEKITPECTFALEPTVRAVVVNYNLSIEQLPLYFARIHGKEVVTSVLNKLLLEMPNEKTKRSLETMLWWLRGRDANLQ